MFYNEVYVVALGPSVYRFYNSRKKPGKRIVSNQDQCIHIRATPITESHAINWKRRKYSLDCREVGRGTQSAACVPIVHVPMI